MDFQREVVVVILCSLYQHGIKISLNIKSILKPITIRDMSQSELTSFLLTINDMFTEELKIKIILNTFPKSKNLWFSKNPDFQITLHLSQGQVSASLLYTKKVQTPKSPVCIYGRKYKASCQNSVGLNFALYYMFFENIFL